MAMLLCSGDSDDPDAVREAVLRHARKLADAGISEEDFLRMKRSAFGRKIRDLDSFSSTCFRLSACYFTDFDYLDFPRLYSTVSSGDVLEFLRRVVRPDRCVRGIVNPNKEAD
jgi:predicted Zn-dependent peptidase